MYHEWMKLISEIRRLQAVSVVLVLFITFTASGLSASVLRVAAYNVLNNPDNQVEDATMATVLDAIGTESVNGLAKRLDILALVETDTGSSVRMADLLNSLYGVSSYEVITSSSFGGDRTGLVYDSSSVTLLDSVDLTGIGVHPIIRGSFRPTETSGDADLVVYAVHLKSGSSNTDKTARAQEATNLRADADALGDGANVLYAGDFNMLGSSEGAWGNMLAGGFGQGFDLADAPGEWRNNEGFKHLHTQNPRTDMDDRFDFGFVSGELLDGTGLDYVPGSFHVFGNNGTHDLNGSITTGTGASPDVLSALVAASDHLPVVADFMVPEPFSITLMVAVVGFVIHGCRRVSFLPRSANPAYA